MICILKRKEELQKLVYLIKQKLSSLRKPNVCYFWQVHDMVAVILAVVLIQINKIKGNAPINSNKLWIKPLMNCAVHWLIAELH